MIKTIYGFLAAFALLFVTPNIRAAGPVAPPETMTLQDCIDLALRQNPSILKAQEEIRRTHGVIVEARAPAIPQITASGSSQLIDKHAIDAFPISTNAPGNSNAVFKNQEQPWTAQVEISQLVYAGGRVRAALRAARLSDQIAALGFQSAVANTLL
ncbi:MAG TPA: TolC family protein, partial [Verrucomicrobiae bacterium]|nr:TolC family protein [Verrucomicrobiae bacterium]